MSRRITIRCQMTDPDLLIESLDDAEIRFVRESTDLLRITQTPSGKNLIRGGIELNLKGPEDTVRASYDEDCARSKSLMDLIQQQYVKNHYLTHAMRQGDQIQKEFIATGAEDHAQIEKGDVVIIASKL